MNTIFLVIIFFLFLLNLLVNKKKLPMQPTSLKWMCRVVYAISVLLYVCILFHIDIPMPTRFFLNHVSPWVFSLINP
jgi:hypothetical protein